MKRASGVLLAILSIAGCETETIAPTLGAQGELQVRPGLVRTIDGVTTPLQIVAFDSDGEPVFPGTVQWLSLDPATVTVSSSGVIAALAPGWGRVIATSVHYAHADTAFVAISPAYAGVAGGLESVCGWESDGTAYCWGGGSTAADNGILGSGAVPVNTATAAVSGGLRFSTIAVGRAMACGLADGAAWCWGNWRLPFGSVSTCGVHDVVCHTPERVATTSRFTHLDIGGNTLGEYVCGSGAAGLVCWGKPPTSSVIQPAQLISASITGPVAVGAAHVCALAGTSAYCWGENRNGQLGTTIPNGACATAQCISTTSLLPVATAVSFSDLKAGSNFTCGLATDGQVFCWGAYDRYVSGTFEPNRAPGNVPVSVSQTLRFNSIAAGPGHACGVSTADELYCWGDAAWTGALGDPKLAFQAIVTEPRRVMSPLTFTRVAPTGFATCGLSVQSGIVCVGEQYSMGHGSYLTASTTPTAPLPPGPLPTYRGMFPDY